MSACTGIDWTPDFAIAWWNWDDHEIETRLPAFFAEQIPELEQGEFRDNWQHAIAARFEQSNSLLSEEFFDGAPVFSGPGPDLDDADEKTYTLEEVGAIVEGIFGKFTLVLEEIEHQSLADARLLRDMALKYENNTPVSREDAVLMMEMASRIAPNSTLIQKKLEEWKSETG
ncbi:hypothetical protein [Roseovarius salis]|uniref:hypothetical protein n=1 Tax=Roseovarius salis TaxID=3376063 RepID=UPI0037C68B53